MASVPGAKLTAAYKISSTWGTAVAVGAGDKLQGEITPNFNVEELVTRQIGSGVSMAQNATRGNFKPTIGIAMDAGYANQFPFIVSQFLGTAAAPAEQTGGQADYMHRVTFNTSINAKYGTFVYESSSAETVEFPSVATRSITVSAEDAPGILNFESEHVANTALISGQTNNNAAVIACTSLDTEVVAYADVDLFRYNAQSGGALSGSDNLAITGYSLTLTRPQEVFGEIKGSAGNSAPLETALFEGSLTINLKDLADHTWFDFWAAETALKSTLNIQGTQIGTGVNKAVTIYIPRMILVTEPQYPVTSEGINPQTLTFKILAASANPTGMSSTYPYFEFINGYSTNLLT